MTSLFAFTPCTGLPSVSSWTPSSFSKSITNSGSRCPPPCSSTTTTVPTLVIHTLSSARRAKNVSRTESPASSQAAAIDHIVNTLTAAPATTTSSTTLLDGDDGKVVKNNTKTRRRRTASKPMDALPIGEQLDKVAPVIPAVPSMTLDETEFLNEQLEKRKLQMEKKTKQRSKMKKASKKKKATEKFVPSSSSTSSSTTTATRKRASKRSTKSPVIKKSGTLSFSPQPSSVKDTFRAFMSEISQNDLLGQSEVAALACKIKQGMVIERTTKQLELATGNRPTITEISKYLSIPMKQVQKQRMEGTAAKNSLVAANLRLVASVASKMIKNQKCTLGLTIDDMIQEGSIGLIRAAEKFDVSRGYKFSTYATWWVRAYVMRLITNQGRCIKVPSSIIDEYMKIRKKFQEMRNHQHSNNYKIPNNLDEMVAKELGMTIGKLRMVVNVVTQVPASLDVSVDINPAGSANSLSKSLGDFIKGDDHVEEKMVMEMERKELDSAMRKYLKPVERAVIRLRFGLEDGQPRSFRETGELLGLSKERIRQIVFRGLPKLKTPEIQRMLVQATSR